METPTTPNKPKRRSPFSTPAPLQVSPASDTLESDALKLATADPERIEREVKEYDKNPGRMGLSRVGGYQRMDKD